MKLRIAGEAKISARGAVNLPAQRATRGRWKHGDHVVVEIVDDDHIVLSRRPEKHR